MWCIKKDKVRLEEGTQKKKYIKYDMRYLRALVPWKNKYYFFFYFLMKILFTHLAMLKDMKHCLQHLKLQ